MKKHIAVMFLLLSFLGAEASAKETVKVLMLISDGFYAPEYYKPRAIFDKEGYQITVGAKYSGLVRPDRRNTDYLPVRADVTFDKVSVKDFDAIVFAGGNGAWEDFFPNSDVHRILTDSLNAGKITALVCSSTGLLGVANNLDGEGVPLAAGRHVTGYKRVEGLLKVMGKVNYDPGIEGKPYVVVDGNLITGRDPESSEAYGHAIVKELNKTKRSQL